MFQWTKYNLKVPGTDRGASVSGWPGRDTFWSYSCCAGTRRRERKFSSYQTRRLRCDDAVIPINVHVNCDKNWQFRVTWGKVVLITQFYRFRAPIYNLYGCTRFVSLYWNRDKYFWKYDFKKILYSDRNIWNVT